MLARGTRAALWPLSVAYGAAVSLRNQAFYRGLMSSRTPPIPVLGVGNLTVGGTGKTPIAAWAAAELARRGAHPAVLLRGYRARLREGDEGDEAAVHRILNPSVPVFVDADRLAGAGRALEEGCDVAVLDDAFQHRGVSRVADLVLVSADAWASAHHLLPAGPWREPLRAIRRARVAVITRKATSEGVADAVASAIARVAPTLAIAVAQIAPDSLRNPAGDVLELDALRDSPVYAVAAVGDPEAFFAQVRELSTTVATTRYPDHYAFGPADAAQIVRDAQRRFPDGFRVVCTLKDAVKLGALLPELWYLTQRVVWERGADAVESAIDAVHQAHHNGNRPQTSHAPHRPPR
jgi:tetraacyldisaccharide 4'-kinase